jgi:hypothetical protein
MAERVQERRRSIIVSCVALFVLCAGVLVAMVIELPLLGAPTTTKPDDLRTVRITKDTIDGSGCRQQTLDNQNWRVTGSKQPCAAVPRDGNTTNRFGAINKSFSGQ